MRRIHPLIVRACLALALGPLAACSPSVPGGMVQGTVLGPDGKPLRGVFASFRGDGPRNSVSILTDAKGRFSFRLTRPEPPIVHVLHRGDTLATARVPVGERTTLRTARGLDEVPLRPSAWWLGTFPEGEEKRKFILDCTGCHQFNETRVNHNGARRSKEQWAEDTRRMLNYAGARSGFPVIAADRDPERTATWLTTYLAGARPANDARGLATPDPAALGVQITEYDLPESTDLPHDLAIDHRRRIVITGMLADAIHVLNPTTGFMGTFEIPVPKANPRAIEIDRHNRWWVLLGNPKKIARYDPDSGQWYSWDIGMYPHSIALSPDEKSVWFNGHFTRDPEEMGRLDPETGDVQRFVLPSHPTLASQGGPLPYEQRIAADGAVWMSELLGNRILRLDPESGNVRVYPMPVSWSGPRRFDIDGRGILWIPAYSGGALWSLDPKTGTFRKYSLPVENALPYVARVNPRDGRVWIGTAAADAVFEFDPASGRFTTYPLPTRGVTIRHLAIDPVNGDVWLAYGAAPALHPARVARLRRFG